MENRAKGYHQGVFWAMELFCIWIVVVVICSYTSAKIHRPAHTHLPHLPYVSFTV